MSVFELLANYTTIGSKFDTFAFWDDQISECFRGVWELGHSTSKVSKELVKVLILAKNLI